MTRSAFKKMSSGYPSYRPQRHTSSALSRRLQPARLSRFRSTRGFRSALLLGVGLACLIPTTTVRADEMLFGFEGDTLPGDAASGFAIFNACDGDCSRRLEAGHFILEWGAMGNTVNYSHLFAEPGGAPPPPTLWVEWRFRSNQPIPPYSSKCDARVTVDYVGINDDPFMFQDAVVDREGGSFVVGLSPEFHTYRFESLDGHNYTFAVDGFVFKTFFEPGNTQVAFIQFGGEADCAAAGPDRPVPVSNEWDYIRYGTLGTGEPIVATVPPAGALTEAEAAGVTTIQVTYAGPNYAYVDDIAVSVSAGTAPAVIATRRLDNGDPSVLEVVLDRALPVGVTTTLTFTDGAASQTIEYAVAVVPVPAASTWGLVTFALGTLIAGAVLLRRRSIC